MILEILVVGPLAVNCFIIGCDSTREAVIIDPGDETDQILEIVNQKKLKVKYILLTHGHVDHLAAAKSLKAKLDVKLLMHKDDLALVQNAPTQAAMFGLPDPGVPSADQYVEEGDKISVGKLEFKVLHTPGHSPGSVTYFINEKLFVGDLIFSGSIGRTDLPGGSYEQLIQSVKNKIFSQPDSTDIYPGHGPATTVGTEKATNPFFN